MINRRNKEKRGDDVKRNKIDLLNVDGSEMKLTLEVNVNTSNGTTFTIVRTVSEK